MAARVWDKTKTHVLEEQHFGDMNCVSIMEASNAPYKEIRSV